MLMGLIIGSGIRLFFVLRHPFLWTVSVWHVFHHPPRKSKTRSVSGEVENEDDVSKW
jgi:hypothetical protein